MDAVEDVILLGEPEVGEAMAVQVVMEPCRPALLRSETQHEGLIALPGFFQIAGAAK